MNKTLLAIRLIFILLCTAGGWLVCYAVTDWDDHRIVGLFVGFLIGVLVVLVDILLKGFSLRGLSAITFGLAVGALIAYLIGTSPLFDRADEQNIYLTRLALFLICTYLCTVIALRGKDEFNLVIPYVRFVPHEVDVPLVVVDTSVLIDGRISKVCEAGFLNGALVIPKFVLKELQSVADSTDAQKRARGRRGLEVLNELRRIKHIDIRIPESEVSKREDVDAKLVFLAESMRAKLLTTDFNLAKMAEFHGVQWLDINQLSRALRPELLLGEILQVDLAKSGKEAGQAIGQKVMAEITSVLPTAGGKMVFARFAGLGD